MFLENQQKRLSASRLLAAFPQESATKNALPEALLTLLTDNGAQGLPDLIKLLVWVLSLTR